MTEAAGLEALGHFGASAASWRGVAGGPPDLMATEGVKGRVTEGTAAIAGCCEGWDAAQTGSGQVSHHRGHHHTRPARNRSIHGRLAWAYSYRGR